MKTEPSLILASGSPRRRELLTLLGFPFQVETPVDDETYPPHLTPVGVVELLAQRKCREISRRYPESVVVAADTVVVAPRSGTILGKPEDSRHALEILQMLAGESHEVYTGVAFRRESEQRERIIHVRTEVHMKSVPLSLLQRYIETGEPLDKAGAYAIQGRGSLLVDSIQGDYFNVVGLPLSRVSDVLEEFGFLPLSH